MPTAPVSVIVLYYRQGDMNVHPTPALVTKSTPQGVLNLTLFPMNAHNNEVVTGCRHRSDPILSKNRDLRLRSGCWDFGPMYHPEAETASPEESQSATIGDPEAIRDLVLQMHKEGRNPGDIARIIGNGMTHQRVGKIIRESTEPVNA